MDVIRLLVQGHSNSEIADGLYLSPNTIRSHLQAISAKLGVTSRAKLAARARALGLA
jgi:DNA-binding CsgD family transcriptional regulator